ncbi:methylated-DNA--[protein]-cysteine S-methyltransferase [Conexibacter sp. DBS9H8]|uniref:methylated-DNA--[protein]-cysteine S-methyltransferase n=1 Tax=Conexibacter sp. DBS9H8 TaxID=2937801 RepID=UPI00200D9A2F|nr:methylated-DNA--[protein]-cysteine S-methyltransferase [Conexibacter sp. DBS9H8]
MISTLIDSPVGPLTARARDGWLVGLAFGAQGGAEDDGALPEVRRQLREYFSGERRTFTLELDLAGTDWERRVWSELVSIPYGETRSYGQIAARACERTGVRAARAVGAANAANPVVIIVPCHRVIGADGRLVGFGGGLETKRRLLDLEAGRLALV